MNTNLESWKIEEIGESGCFRSILIYCIAKSMFYGKFTMSSSSATGVPWLKLGVSLVPVIYYSMRRFLNPGIIAVAGIDGYILFFFLS